MRGKLAANISATIVVFMVFLGYLYSFVFIGFTPFGISGVYQLISDGMAISAIEVSFILFTGKTHKTPDRSLSTRLQ
tara:strand:- start:6453 stop:6683 length:231 start_codon:yes stop_codon:yes gene_type:complete